MKCIIEVSKSCLDTTLNCYYIFLLLLFAAVLYIKSFTLVCKLQVVATNARTVYVCISTQLFCCKVAVLPNKTFL